MRALATFALVAGCGACGAGDTEVRIEFESPAVAQSVEVVLVWVEKACPAGASLTMAPADPVRSAVVPRGTLSVALGAVPEGHYGVHAIARGADCAVLAAGCQPVSLDGEDHVDVTLADQAAEPGCAGAEVCARGECLPEGTCAPEGDVCARDRPCCTGTCSPEVLHCVPVGP